MNSANKKTGKKHINIDSDDESLIEELEAYSAISNHSKKSSSKKKKQNKSSSSESSSESESEESSSESDDKKKKLKKPIKKLEQKSESDSDEKEEKPKKEKKNKNQLGLDFNNPKSFDKAVVEWVKADNRQKELKKENKFKKENDGLNAIKKEASQFITKTMRDEGLPKVDINKGKLILNKTPIKTKLTMDFIEESLSKHFTSKQVDKIIDIIDGNMEETQRYNIKRVAN
jgi:hypothetical protein